MNANDLGIFARILVDLQAALQPGMTLLRPVLLLAMTILVTIAAVFIAVGIIFLRASIPASLTRFVLRTSVLVAVFLAAPRVMTTIVEGFTQLGLLAGNNTITIAQFMDPGAWLGMGFMTAQPLLDAWARTGYFSFFDGVVYLFFWLVMMAAFFYMCGSLFVLQLQMSLALAGTSPLCHESPAQLDGAGCHCLPDQYGLPLFL
jgi:type IV secretory pathway TrbL component